MCYKHTGKIDAKTLLRTLNLLNNDQDEDNDSNTFMSIISVIQFSLNNRFDLAFISLNDIMFDNFINSVCFIVK